MPLDPRSTIAAVIDMWNGGSVDLLHDLLAPDYRGHMLHLADGERDADSYSAWIQRSRDANPGVAYRVLEQFRGPDRLVTRLEACQPPGIAGKGRVSRGINISRFDADGLLAEEWAIWSPWLDE